jgi:LuxR family quorum sensing-dependent transcriptional regulator
MAADEHKQTLLGEILEGDDLTVQEAGTLLWAARGRTAAQTGRRMILGAETVRSYRKRAIAKLGARNLTHAVARAIAAGVVPVDEIEEEAA